MKGYCNHDQTTPDGRVIHHSYGGAVPLFMTARVANFERQNGGRCELTSRQQRAVRRAQRRVERHTVRTNLREVTA